ncbi:Rab-GAP TBC domain-containing protein [Madurella fahalii]|uniref:Rab-GAP TBC domain-containing protein n=1 Tax=Madurella fahalii TaxID=1157608 RepID=A0ABQ0GNN6_9PEZI
MGSNPTEDAAGGGGGGGSGGGGGGGGGDDGDSSAGYYPGQPQYHQYSQQPGMMGHRGPVPYASRLQTRQQWPNAGPWPKHGDAGAADAVDQDQSHGRVFRLANFPLMRPRRPSSSPRPVLELKSDGHVPPDLLSARSDSFFHNSPTTRTIPTPSPTALHFQSQHRTRAESTPTPRPPRSAFPGLSSNPFIPETPEPETSHSETRKFPLLSRQYEQLNPLSPVSNPESPVQSRQPTPTEGNMIENFSRPRKPSIRSQPSDGALSRRLAAARLHAGTPVDQETSSPQWQTNFNAVNPAQAPNPWPRTRRFSGSSSHSSSTFSSIPPRPSDDHLNAAPATSSLRHVNPPVTSAPAPQARPPVAHNNYNYNYNHNYNAPQPLPREVLPPWLTSGDELRSSFRSQLTASTAQGTFFTAAGTERNSILTKASSVTEQSIINGYARRSWRANSVDDGPSLEDVMGMYERGFNDSDIESVRRSMRFAGDDDPPDVCADDGELDMEGSRPQSCRSEASGLRAKMLEAMNDSLPIPGAVPIPGSDRSTVRQSVRRSLLPNSLPKDIGFRLATEHMAKRDSVQTEGTGKHDSAKLLDGDDGPDLLRDESTESSSPTSTVPAPSATTEMPPSRSITPAPAPPPPQEPPEDPGSRDRYGFRKANAYITRQQYDAWDGPYSEYLARRRKKWIAFLKDNSLMTDRPNRFPPRSTKTKRFIRKGIPPDWRGAAWFYYAGGPAVLSKHRGVYEHLIRRAGLHPESPPAAPGETGEVKPLIVEDIEKDLYRTFPDNVRFKPPPRPPAENSTEDAGSTEAGPSQPPPEPEIITSLRRVLHAFALYNPRIGYCQSLNFLAGLLLLFVETEEQAFWLLNIITRVYLPGTHEMSLEGSKVDLGVLMVALKDSMPAVWKQIGGDELEVGSSKKGKGRRGRDHKRNLNSINDPNRLPAITLCMTAWFMSCFIGTLPIETVLRVWDVFFYEGSRTLFRVALTLFKLGEAEIKAVQDPMEMFGVVQTFPRRMIDCNTLMETCYKRRNGIGHLSQESVEEKRQERREGIRRWKAEQEAAASETSSPRPGTRHRLGLDLAADLDDVRRKGTLFSWRKDREQTRAAEVM